MAYPINASQKLVDVEDEKKLRVFMDKRISQEIDGGAIGDEYKGYIFRITGGNDKQGFAMMQGVLHPSRVRLLLDHRHPGYRPRRTGERKRKSVRGCIVSSDLSVLNLVVVKKGDAEIEGLTDRSLPRRLGPKRASKIRKLFNLSKKDDVRKYVIRREIPAKEAEGDKPAKKAKSKSAKIQRLVTPLTLQRKRHRLALKKKRSAKAKEEAATYAKLIQTRLKEMHDKREERLSKRREERQSQLSAGGEHPAGEKTSKSETKEKDASKTTAKAAKDEGKKTETKKSDSKKPAAAAKASKAAAAGGAATTTAAAPAATAAPAPAPAADAKGKTSKKGDAKATSAKTAAAPAKAAAAPAAAPATTATAAPAAKTEKSKQPAATKAPATTKAPAAAAAPATTTTTTKPAATKPAATKPATDKPAKKTEKK